MAHHAPSHPDETTNKNSGNRAQQIQWYLTQPFYVAEPYMRTVWVFPSQPTKRSQTFVYCSVDIVPILAKMTYS